MGTILLEENPRKRRKGRRRRKTTTRRRASGTRRRKTVRRRRRRAVAVAATANPRRRRRRKGGYRRKATRRRRNPSRRGILGGLGLGGIGAKIGDGVGFAAAAVAGEGLTRLALNKLGLKAIFDKLNLPGGEDTKRGLAQIAITFIADPVLRMAKLKPAWRARIVHANIAMAILSMTKGLQAQVWKTTGLEDYVTLSDYVTGGERMAPMLSGTDFYVPPKGLFAEPEVEPSFYVPQSGILGGL